MCVILTRAAFVVETLPEWDIMGHRPAYLRGIPNRVGTPITEGKDPSRCFAEPYYEKVRREMWLL